MKNSTVERPLPQVVQDALLGAWPKTLRGPDIVDIIILIEYGMNSETFWIRRDEEAKCGIWKKYLDSKYTASLQTLQISDVQEPEGGCAEQSHAEYYATLHTKAPPIITLGNKLLDGHHRLVAARLRQERFIDAYVISF